MVSTKISCESAFKDTIFANHVMIHGHNSFGYIVHNGYETRIYNNYETVENFKTFTNEMETHYADAFKQYSAGSGQELLSKNLTPPKMACLASSSRFCYKALRDGDKYFNTNPNDWTFEKPCPIFFISDKSITKNVSQQPHLDAYCSNNNTYIEAKCQEIFNDPTTKLKRAYWEYIFSKRGITYDEGNDTKPYEIGFNIDPDRQIISGSEFDIPYDMFGITLKELTSRGKKVYLKHFDFKQFLCHLLGIACENIRNNITGTTQTATLCYMFFKPISDDKDTNEKINNVFQNLELEIKEVFNSQPIQTYCQQNNIKLMAIAEEAKVMEQLTTTNKLTLYP